MHLLGAAECVVASCVFCKYIIIIIQNNNNILGLSRCIDVCD
jgi:hypothetical protein